MKFFGLLIAAASAEVLASRYSYAFPQPYVVTSLRPEFANAQPHVMTTLRPEFANGVNRKVFYHRTSSSFPPEWNDLGLSSPNAAIDFNLYLPQQHLQELERLFWAVSDPQSPQYQEFKTREEIIDLVSPRDERVEPLISWLLANGVNKYEIGSYGDALQVKTSVMVASKLFGAEFHDFKHPSGRINVAHVGPASIPAELASYVELVYGLSDFPVGKKARLGHTSPNGGGYLVVAQSYQAIYGVPSNFKPTQPISQGTIQFIDQTYSPEGMDAYSANVQALRKPTPDTTVGKESDSPQDEAQLDMTAQPAIGSGVEQWFWLEDDQRWMLSFATHFFNTTKVPLVASISYAWSEMDQCGDVTNPFDCQTFGVNNVQFINRTNTEFQKIGLRGTSILVASGDSGVFGRTDETCSGKKFRPDYPASSPFVTSVAGTYNKNPTYLPSGGSTPTVCKGACINGGDEVAIAYSPCSYASGGGFAIYSPRPAYQQAAVQAYLQSGVKLPAQSYYNSSNRAFPDVSAQGYNILVFDSKAQSTPESGTSAAAPAFSGVVSLLNDLAMSKTGKPLGFVNPMLYQLQAATPDAFIDIVQGDNRCTENGCGSTCVGFNAYKGWDAVSGLGSPNYPKMLEGLEKMLTTSLELKRRSRVTSL